MRYTLEYLNDDEVVEIIRFDADTKTFDIVKRTGGDYDPPDEGTVFFCEEVDTTEDGGVLRVLGEFYPQQTNDSSRWHDVTAYKFIKELVDNGEIVNFVISLLDSMEENKEKNDFVKHYDTRRKH